MQVLRAEKYGVYIHIPFCKRKCDYCAFCSITDFSLQARYVERLIKEISDSAYKGAPVDTVYIGGGTPSCLFRGGLLRVLNAVKNTFSLEKNAEITVEANPESCDDMFIYEALCGGVNRVSLGLQSANNKTLKEIGRIHTFETWETAVRKIIDAGISNISSDMILGFYGQKQSDVSAALDVIAKYCEHISVYALSIEENTPMFDKNYRPDDDATADLYDFAYARLKNKGFERYEVSNFAKNGKISRHNSKYWEYEPYLGFGAAAHGFDGKSRSFHDDDVKKYIEECNVYSTELTPKDMYNEFVMLALRTENGLPLHKFADKFGYDFMRENAVAVSRMLKDGYMEIAEDFLRVAPSKMFVMNNIIEEFLK